MQDINEDENLASMLRGELYYAFTPRLTEKRMRCHHACDRFNGAGEVDRRRLVELWREYVFTLLQYSRSVSDSSEMKVVTCLY